MERLGRSVPHLSAHHPLTLQAPSVRAPPQEYEVPDDDEGYCARELPTPLELAEQVPIPLWAPRLAVLASDPCSFLFLCCVRQ